MGDGGKAAPARTPHGGFLFITNGARPAETAAPSSQKGKKRPHHKSRRGCLACKRRKVKCDERFPCSNCLKRSEDCIRSATEAHKSNGLSAYASQPITSHPHAVNDTGINLLHMELFYHFQSDIMGTLVFPEIWQHVLPWSFQEPYIMCTILCLAATHLSTLRPEVPQYSRAALQLLGTSASLFREKLSNPVTAQNIEALIATSLLMHYISWSNVEFFEEQLEEKLSPDHKEHGGLIMHLSRDPLFQLSSGVRGIFSEAFPILWGSDSVFLSASLYSPRTAIEETILQHGDDPHRFLGYFMAIWDDPRYQPQQTERQGEDEAETQGQPLAPPHLDTPSCTLAKLNYVCTSFRTWTTHDAANMSLQEQREPGDRLGSLSLANADTTAETEAAAPASSQNAAADPRRMAFERVAKRLSLLFCLVSISRATVSGLASLRPDIERCVFSFPVLCSIVFRDLALRHDPKALVVLCHFYRAARILLTSPASWWARQRSRVMETLILRDLRSRGLEMSILAEASGDGNHNSLV